jgi:pimeloyl-ACP methyl ester carboxylesterase
MTMPLSEKKEVTVDGLTITYYESGSGVPLILLHGWPQTSHIWRKVIPELQKHYRVLSIDLPGMGNLNAAPNADTRSIANVIHSFCKQLNLGSIHLVAHDIGAWVATAFALEHEKSLRSLIVLDAGIPGLIPDEAFSPLNAKKIWQFYFHAIDGMPEFLIVGKEKEYLAWYFTQKATIKEAISEDDISIYVEAYTGKERLKNGFDYYRAFPESAAQNKGYANKVSVPVLAIGGDNAQGLNVGIAMQKISDNKIQAVSIPDCGHYIAEEQPAVFLNLVLDFLHKLQ